MFTYFTLSLEKSTCGYEHGAPLISIVTNCPAYSQMHSDSFDHSPEGQGGVVTETSSSEARQPGFESYFCLPAMSPGQVIYPLCGSFLICELG